MDARADLAAMVGHTPLLRLRRACEATGCDILGKAEWLNPGGSIKDRTALGLLLDAERGPNWGPNRGQITIITINTIAVSA